MKRIDSKPRQNTDNKTKLSTPKTKIILYVNCNRKNGEKTYKTTRYHPII